MDLTTTETFQSSQKTADGQLLPIQRIAAIDLGTNSFHAVVVDLYSDGSFYTIDKLKEMVLLAQDGLEGRLSDDAIERGLQALLKIKTLCEHQGAEKILAYATSAIREAENGGEFIQRCIDEIGIKPLAIPGKLEAELIGHAVQHAIALDEDPVLIADIGGGSVEFIIGNNKQFFFLDSKKIGTSRLSSRFVHSDPVSKKEIKSIRDYLDQHLDGLKKANSDHPVKSLIGSSGTMENFAAMIANRTGMSTEVTLNEFEYSADQFNELYDTLIRMNRKKRQKMKGLDEKRVDILYPGLILVKMLIEQFDIKNIRTSTQALREGIILRYVKKEMDEIKLLEGFADTRKRSIYEFLRKCNWHEEHSRHVAKMAIVLFDNLQAELGLTRDDRELLEFAALMHDIGYLISRRKHHKHALYMIRHADLNGFNEREINIMANVARYHRRSRPKKRHEHYMSMDEEDRELIRKLSGILRVADGLDRSHYQNVKKLEVEIDDSAITLRIETEADPELEIWGAMRKCKLFRQVTGRELTIKSNWD